MTLGCGGVRGADRIRAGLVPPILGGEAMRYDMRASVYELDGQGSDGAYSLIGDDLTADEVAERVRAVLSGDWGLTNAGECRLAIHIGPAGRGDDLPL